MKTVNKSTAEWYQWGCGCDGWRLLDRPDLSVILEHIPPGLGEVRHYHSEARQLFYVLEGRLQIELDDKPAQLAKGDSLEVPPAAVHRVRNPFNEDVSFLVISAPSTSSDRVNLEPPPVTTG